MKKLIFFALIFLHFSANAGEIKGFIKKNNSVYQFDDFTKVDTNTEVSIKYKANKKETIKISYAGPNNNNRSVGEVTLEPNQIFSFPQNGKYVLFEEVGMHTIIVEPNASDPLAINFYVSKEKVNESFFGDFKDSKDNDVASLQAMMPKVNSSSYINNISNFKEIKNIKNPPSQRTSGSKIYKEISGSTVFIIGDKAIGSGVVIKNKKKSNSKKLLIQILTNYHVIKDQKKIGVIKKPSEMSNVAVMNSEIYSAKVLKVNKNYDLALLEIEHKKIGGFFNSDLKAVRLGSQEDLEVGSKTHAIGHPSQKYWTYTQGVISQIRNNYEWSYDKGWSLKANVIQTQTPINPGNSGGPLINDDFELIGLNSFIDKGEGLNYAISISTIKDFLNGNNQTLASLMKSEARKKKKAQTQKVKNSSGKRKCVFISAIDVYKGYGSNIKPGEDGYKETEVWDCIGGREADTWKVDTTQDKKTNQIWVDSDSNGHIDLLIEYVFYQGNLHTIVNYFDNTSSLKLVKRGFDFDNDGNVDKWDYS